jgi:nucleoside 2-deoxyribosyltransferase
MAEAIPINCILLEMMGFAGSTHPTDLPASISEVHFARPDMTITAYLAGPDVFFPEAAAHAARKVEICRRHGLHGLPPLNEDIETAATALDVWRVIYEKDIAMMERSDIIIANLTPFGGASADAGTLIEVGWFLGRGKPVFGYSNSSETFEVRMRQQLGERHADFGIEGFHLPDNLMIVGAVSSGGYPFFVPNDGRERGLDALDVFETCVEAAARHAAGGSGKIS